MSPATSAGTMPSQESSFAAIRLVGWDEHDAGYIDNVAGTNQSACIQNGVRTFPTWAGQPAAALPEPRCPRCQRPLAYDLRRFH